MGIGLDNGTSTKGRVLAASHGEAEKFGAARPAVTAGGMSVRLHKINHAVHAGPETWAALS